MESRWNYCVKNVDILHRVKEKRNILQTVRRRKAAWVRHTMRINCLLNLIIQGKIGGYGRRGRGRMQLLDDLKEGRRYWKVYVALSGEFALEEANDEKTDYAMVTNRIFPFVVLKTPDIIMRHCVCCVRISI